MCTSNSTIMYGLVIKTWTLLVAAHAFPKIQPILLALDMILLRRRNGQLRMSEMVVGKKNFSDLPEEIIGMVRTQVFGTVSMRHEANEFIAKKLSCGYRLERCSCGHFHSEDHLGNRIGIDWTVFLEGDCGRCDDEYYTYLHSIYNSNLDEFVSHYGLSLRKNQSITDPEGYELDKFYSAVSIPIPSNSITSEANHDTSRSSATPLYFDTTTIDTTSATSRFKRLVKDWGLKLYEEPVQVMGKIEKEDIAVADNRAEGDEKKDVKAVKKEKVVKIKPRWFIWNECDVCN